MTPLDESASRCPECGAALDGPGLSCWLCGGEQPEQVANPFASPAASARQPGSPVQFSLDTLFLVTTLIAVCIGTALAAPGLGFLLIVVVVPAVIRTMVARARNQTAVHHPTTGEKLVTFLVSFGISAAVLAAGVAAFAVVAAATLALCVNVVGEDPTRSTLGWTFMVVFYASPVFGVGLTAWLFWLTRPRRKTGR